LRTCPKCGRANAVTRKYCVRCGNSLVLSAESVESTHAEAPNRKEAAEPISSNGPEVRQVSANEGMRYVRPSEIDRDRMRTAERHVEKTEFEKAREAFARSEETDERLLRASELRDLQSEIHRAAEVRPAQSGPSRPQGLPVQQPPPSSVPSLKESPQGQYVHEKDVEKQILRGAKEAESTLKTANPSGTELPTLPMGAPPAGSPPSASSSTEARGMSPGANPAEPAPFTPGSRPAPAAPAAVAPSATLKPSPNSIVDSRVRQLEADIKALAAEKEQLENELVSVQSRLHEEVERLRIETEAKRTRAEATERDFRFAKKEYGDTKKEFEKTEKRQKKEISDAEKRIDAAEKRMKRARDAREKRLRELEKERVKREAET
jgi:DNA repair exonuclease SbcCD ATPase subunit